MKYKVGDEVLVKAKIISGVRKYFGVDVKDNRFDICEDDIVPVPDMTAEEAWEIAKKISLLPYYGGLENIYLRNIFGTDDLAKIMNDNSADQAKSKIEAWEAEKKIKVGDEVVVKSDPYNDDCKFFVTHMNYRENEISGVSSFDGGVFYGRKANQYQKTGRHINIDGLLKQIGGSDA